MAVKEKKYPNVFETNQNELNSFVVNIEFLLISVVQGVALAALASAAATVLGNFHVEFFLYVASAFLFILTFWSQAIIHTLSFIDWPMNIAHNFLYFTIAFFEVIAFTALENPLKYFIFIVIFFVVAAVLYGVDLSLIKLHKDKYNSSKETRALYRNILKRHTFELRVLVPIGLLYNIVCVFLIYFYPATFIDRRFHVLLISLQLAFGILAMYDSIRSFKTRSRLITACINPQKD